MTSCRRGYAKVSLYNANLAVTVILVLCMMQSKQACIEHLIDMHYANRDGCIKTDCLHNAGSHVSMQGLLAWMQKLCKSFLHSIGKICSDFCMIHALCKHSCCMKLPWYLVVRMFCSLLLALRIDKQNRKTSSACPFNWWENWIGTGSVCTCGITTCTGFVMVHTSKQAHKLPSWIRHIRHATWRWKHITILTTELSSAGSILTRDSAEVLCRM